MDATNQFVSDPAVVIDNVSMTYKVATNESGPAGSSPWSKVLRRLSPGQRMATVHALKPMSMVASHGETIGVIGRNGSGKSTLMRLIGGQERPTTGTVLATNTPVALGVSAALMPDLPGEENVHLGCLAMGLTPAQVAAKYDQIVELSGLESAIHLPMKSYSSGMSSRLRFAIATAIDPEILILDEALNTGDAEFSQRTKARMTELRKQAGCVFLVSHAMESIRDLCNRVIWLDKGDFLHDGEPEAVIRLYERFIEQLRRGDLSGADKTKRAARREMQAVEIRESERGRRSIQ